MDVKVAVEIGDWIYAIFAGIILWSGVLGNVLVIVYVLFKEKHKSSYKTNILLLAIIDLVGCLTFICAWLQNIQHKWFFGFFGCQLLKPLGIACVYIANWLIVGMSYERYRGITKPLTVQIQRKHVYLYVLLLCIVWTLAHTHYFMAAEMYHGNCYIALRREYKALAFFIPRLTAGVIIPSILMIYFYFLVRKTLQNQQKSLQNSDILRRNKAVLGTLRMLIIAFILCVNILEIVNVVIKPLSLLKPNFGHEPWFIVFFSLLSSFRFINNAVNCFVYAGYIKRFRNWLLCIFCPVAISFRRRAMQGSTRSTQTTRRN